MRRLLYTISVLAILLFLVGNSPATTFATEAKHNPDIVEPDSRNVPTLPSED
ncbi:hypothetical protein [Sutcliffiella rhizosphaerae]|uniref:Uncharacterized protein n=1 Tax=Sutcliffiella rhizosphaerae TaxID=2880967 RepID=A0ABN8ABZ1_9BACI|nr:hypothetical protein [Sutcliffiella rhizosphaerae]CAG9621192.1 hypothetical protein BACCIP111883_01964 [Sutcliffiella rhizosphaerae]